MNRILAEHRTILLLLAGAFIVRFVVATTFDPPMFSDDQDYHALGQSLAHGNGYQLEGKPTAYRTPGYPIFLAAVYSLFGDTAIPVRIVQAIFDTLSCLLVFLIGSALISGSVGISAAWIMAVFPIQILYVSERMTETLFTFFLLLVVWFLVNPRFESKRWTTVAAGLALGFAALIRPVVLLLPVSIFFARNFFAGFGLTQFKRVSLLAFGCGLVLAPWLIRNQKTFGSLSLASSTGVNFWIGNNPSANGSFSFPKVGNPLLAIEDDFERSEKGTRLALQFIKDQPLRWLTVEAKKFAHFFAFDYWLAMTLQYNREWRGYPNSATIYSEFGWWSVLLIHTPFVLLLLVACAGWIFARRAEAEPIRMLAWVILYWLGVHLIFFATARYRFPMHALMAILAAYGIELLRTKSFVGTKTRTLAFVALTLLFVVGWSAEVWTVRNKNIPSAHSRTP